ncbi:MAG TPA: aryl-sulfate sulfotransferase [Terriglobia bacterium]|nr:aryl-sulfate sulfotransferase [Terriglobia bacterium]
MDVSTLLRRLAFCSALLLVAKIATFGHATIVPLGLTISKPGVQPGYVIFGAPDGHAYAIDVKANVAKKWSAPEPGSELQYARPLANGNLLAQVRSAKSVVGAAGADSVIEITQDGRIVWRYSDSTRFLHHDMERRSNGNTLLVCSKDLDAPQISRKRITDDCLIEVDPSGKIVWEWQTADHIDDLELPHEVRAQIMEGYPSGQRTGLPAPTATRGFDYLHMNAASPIPESAGHTDPRFKPGNVIVSYRYINTLALVDRDSKKIVWKTVGLTIGQHNPHFVPGGLPGTGNLLVFDNGYVDGNTNPYRASTRPYSRVLEINPLDKSIVWEYTAENSNRPIWTFFSHYISGVQRQPNGNTLICEGSNGRIFEVTPTGEIVWEYVNPFPNLTPKIPNSTIFRAAKVAENWLKR